jgi:hypothetical protein
VLVRFGELVVCTVFDRMAPIQVEPVGYSAAAAAPARADDYGETAARSWRPPAGAQTYYKVVAVMSSTRFVSIFDGRTEYALDEVTAPRGGCWVCPDMLAVVRHATTLPSRSARLHAPRKQCVERNEPIASC